VAFSPDGRKLLSSSAKIGAGEGIIWDAASGKLLRKLGVVPGFLQSISWSPDGKTLAMVTRTSVIVLDADAGTVVNETKSEANYVPISLLWKQGCGLWVANGDHQLMLLRPGAQSLPERINTGDSLSVAIAWNPTTNRLATAQNNGLIREWTPAAK
jgi:WD40 repeat protein